MTIGLLKEPAEENRVSLLPETVKQLIQMKTSVWVSSGAGSRAFAADATYEQAGAVVHDAKDIYQQADLLLHIQPFSDDEIALLKKEIITIGVYQPLYHFQQMQQLATAGVTVFSLDSIPRSTRAQSMDVLSSQANIAGYKAVLLAASTYSRYFPMLMTSAGSIAPAKVLILGAGVAGLQAVATAKRLGAVVEVFDTRPAVKEEVNSLGGKFIEVEGAADASTAAGYAVEQSEEFKQRQKAKIAESASKADIIITTAQIPGKKAPVLITKAMLDNMKPGSVIIDLAAATGGNTEATQNDNSVEYNNVTIIGNSNLAATVPADASKLYGKNVLNFLKLIIDKDGKLNLNFADDIVKAGCITHQGEIVNERVKALTAEKL